ncbi:hypothetical protein BST81_06170 [Leptolyngbya sp. 'hensonii']|uniref:DUF2656 domain-containing protein n=1 Tax=Leptolyngbya sp. 'hensonii' TaxID=1922337 RepID=UPI00094F7AC4|nr:DUF2656 domain-containing protein [Leptolyngbya sp. 'hensonii']OLP19336.1 hypothetical protein BST81_06170 [Leptolyngbya sp. 'hensonii']
MNENYLGRMLLSHNFDVGGDSIPALNREEFFAVFREGLNSQIPLQCRLVNNPHWIVEIRFPSDEFSPAQVGQLCALALVEKRQAQGVPAAAMPEVLILGGLKTTPPTSDSPDALQPGEWGVDVVETTDGATFLQTIQWNTVIAEKPQDSIFKVELKTDQVLKR